MLLAEHLRPARIQITVPVGPDGLWIDSGRWREVGVTHWHLLRRDWGRYDRERFDNARIAADRQRPSHGVARGPHEVADWLSDEVLRAAKGCPVPDEMLRIGGLATDDGRRLADEVRFWAAMRGRDVAAMMGMGSTRIADMSAYAMTPQECSEH